MLWEPIVTEWHAHRLQSMDPTVRKEAVTRLVELGSSTAMEALATWLKGRAEETRERYRAERAAVGFEQPPDRPFEECLNVDGEACAAVSILVREAPGSLGLFLSRVDEDLVEEVLAVLDTNREDTVTSILDCMRDPSPRIRCLALRSFGTASDTGWQLMVPARAQASIVDLLGDRDPLVRESAACTLWGIFPRRLDVRKEIRRALTSRKPEIRARAARVLADSGLGRCAQEELVGALNDEESRVREAAIRALACRYDRDVLEALWTRLDVADGQEATEVASAIRHFVEHAPELSSFDSLVPRLIGLLGKPEKGGFPECQKLAALALASLGPEAAAAAQALEQALDTAPYWPFEIYLALASLGPEADVDEGTLMAFLKETHWSADFAAGNFATYLAALGTRARPAVPFLLDLVADRKQEAARRRAAMQSVVTAAPEEPCVVTAVLALLRNQGEETSVREAAARSLGECGTFAGRVRPLLEEVLGDSADDAGVRGAAAESLGRLATEDTAQATLEVLLAAIAEQSAPWAACLGAVQGLGAMGPLASGALPALQDMLRESRRVQPAEVAMAIWRIDPSRAPRIVDFLWRRSHGIHGPYLAQLGPEAAPAIPELVRRLAASPWTGRDDFPSATLLAIGKPAVPPLVEALSSEDVILRAVAAEILGRIGPDAIDALPALTRALEDPDAEVRREARKALERIRRRRVMRDAGSREALFHQAPRTPLRRPHPSGSKEASGSLPDLRHSLPDLLEHRAAAPILSAETSEHHILALPEELNRLTSWIELLEPVALHRDDAGKAQREAVIEQTLRMAGVGIRPIAKQHRPKALGEEARATPEQAILCHQVVPYQLGPVDDRNGLELLHKPEPANSPLNVVQP